MPRKKRLKSKSNYYHTIIRGVGRQIIFECKEDYQYFLKNMKELTEVIEIDMCAFCLMENHAHFLLHDPFNNMSAFMHRLQVKYALYFNNKYDRVGHLFQNRFLSEAIDDEQYLRTVIRYILRNPEKAMICKVSDYPWSSYHEYFQKYIHINDTFIHNFYVDREHFEEYINRSNDDECLEFSPPNKDINCAKEVMTRELHIENGSYIRTYSKEQRDEALQKLKKAGLSTRQIERLTGISRGVVQKL